MTGPDDQWYESEESTRLGMIVEVQRIRRRTRARPIPVLLVAAALTFGITYILATRKTPHEAEVVLALTEGSLSRKHVDSGVPVEALREYVANVLLPDAKLLELIERRNLSPSRKRLGDKYAIEELRSQVDIQIWKNTFVSDEDVEQKSARIGITVSDLDPDLAYDLARDLATIVIQTAQDHRQQMTNQLSLQIGELRDSLDARLTQLSKDTTNQELAVQKARREGNEQLAQALDLALATLWHEQKRAVRSLNEIAANQDVLVDRISAAGLDMTVTVVEEHRPEISEHHGFVIALIAIVIGIGTLLGAALLLGAFDSRVHDVDDVERLGLAVLGHLPGFAGDHVGSLEARGVTRARVPSFIRWLSHR